MSALDEIFNRLCPSFMNSETVNGYIGGIKIRAKLFGDYDLKLPFVEIGYSINNNGNYTYLNSYDILGEAFEPHKTYQEDYKDKLFKEKFNLYKKLDGYDYNTVFQTILDECHDAIIRDLVKNNLKPSVRSSDHRFYQRQRRRKLQGKGLWDL